MEDTRDPLMDLYEIRREWMEKLEKTTDPEKRSEAAKRVAELDDKIAQIEVARGYKSN